MLGKNGAVASETKIYMVMCRERIGTGQASRCGFGDESRSMRLFHVNPSWAPGYMKVPLPKWEYHSRFLRNIYRDISSCGFAVSYGQECL